MVAPRDVIETLNAYYEAHMRLYKRTGNLVHLYYAKRIQQIKERLVSKDAGNA